MKTLRKLTVALVLCTLGISISQNVNAKVASLQNRTAIQIAEVNDSNGSGEAAKLQSLAKITPQQAQKAAEANVGSKANSVKLENENGSLIYAVMIDQKEVTVDAGNGKVLYVENANQDEKTETSHAKSTIQVPNTGDGDGETDDDGGK